MIIFEHILFGIKVCSLLQKKVQKKMLEKNLYVSRNFLTPFFCLEKQTPEKNDQKKKKKEITRQTKKIKGQLKNRKEFLLKI